MTLHSPVRRALSLAGAALLAAPHAARAQSMPPYVPLEPQCAWRTIETPHFVLHYPAALEAWTRDVAAHVEEERDAVGRLVGFAPPGRITVLVADPYNDSNGSAYPFLRGPAVFLWPVPPDPRDGMEGARRWARLLVVHEVAHVAHLARPTRNPLRGRLAALLPTNVGPIGARTPRWVWEGYATFVEGKLGGGRPFGAWRPAFLREWALEGRLPTYAAVSGSGGYAGGSFAYLAGSAYLEWLVSQRGDSSLPAVWRRLTARTPRSFDAAFAGVFPGTPGELYARWTAQVTAEAVAAERALRAAPGGLVEGTLVQRLRGTTGDPAVTRDGERVALVVRSPDRAPRVVVWRTGAEPPDTARRRAAARAARRQRRLDPEDVPAVPYLPAPKRAVATLVARDGRAFRAPRWMPDGARLLVERDEPRADGTFRPDLWLWDSRRDALRRVTRGAAVRGADPSPDGATALATRCAAGWCDLVRVDLASGAVALLAAGSPTRSYARPRWAADGRRFAVAVLDEGRWRVRVGDASAADVGGSLRTVGPDDGAARYEPAFLRGDSALVLTSERGGVPDIERVDLATGAATTLTRVTGAAMAAEPIGASDAMYFLALRGTGLDLRRLALDGAAPLAVVSLVGDSAGGARVATGPGAATAATAVVERAGRPADDAAPTPVPPSRAYGLGPHRYALLPAGSWTADGNSALGVLAGADPVGRLTWVLLGAAGAPATWRGGSLSAALRLRPATLDLQAFGAAQRFDGALARYHGGVVALAPRAVLGAATVAGRLGGSLGTLSGGAADSAGARSLGFVDLRAGLTRGRGDAVLSLSIGGSAAAGRSGGAPFARWLGAVGAAARTPRLSARAGYATGETNRAAPTFERFAVGGPDATLIDASVLGQRLALPALPTGALVGRRVETARVGLGAWRLEPYAFAARTPDVSSRWRRVVGAEASWVTGPVPFARAPGVRAVGGIGYPLDGPTRRRAQLYVAISPRP